MILWKLGCRWGRGTPLFYDFIKDNSIVIGWVDKDYSLDDSVLVTDGHSVLDIANIKSVRRCVTEFPEYEEIFKKFEIPFDSNIFLYDVNFLNIKEEDRFKYPLQKGIVKVGRNEYFKQFQKLRDKYMAIDSLNDNVKVLRYKKQIILQGPPGTGKTKLAKEIAKELIGGNISIEKIPETIDQNIIVEKAVAGTTILSARDGVEYSIVRTTDIGVEVKASSNKNYIPNYQEIIDSYAKRVWQKEGNLKGGNDSYSAAVAKYIYKLFDEEYRRNYANQIKILQFHPSYTYEDFVRGIVSKPNIDGDGIVYEAEDKALGAFAKLALENYVASLNKQITSSETDVFEAFIDSIKEEMVENEEHKVNITDAVYLFSADESRFKYKGNNWVAHSKGLNMKFSELLKIIDSGAKERQDLKKLVDLEELTRQHATYFIKVVEKYYVFKSVYKKIDEPRNNVEQKNYILIIDEINRANLSAVLGELIYALEYRGEPVESMYAVDGDNKLILPPNLYIIGTMNTADRSVGHIDYAIRRRFAFVDVLPKDLSQELGIKFDSKLFSSVSQLFETNLSSEFDKNDVQLGHSYFIDKSEEGGSMDIRLKYEIAPILFEYVKDGILIGDDINQKIEDLGPSV